ncbi:MAG: LytR/AlgR family response regulator transcription factor [Rhodothermales bacterium]
MRVLIVEDELVIAQRLERLLTLELAGELTHLDRCATLEEAEKWLIQHPVDVVFLDLNLNGQDGFNLVKDITSRAFHTVVVSAHTERAMEAFEIGVLDFVGKPFGAERIHKTVERLRGTQANHPAASLAIRSAGRIDLVPIADVAYIQAAGSYSELVLRDGAVRVHSKSLERLLAILPPTFERIHRSYVVRLDEVIQVRVREGSRYAAVLASGQEIPIGRTRVDAVRARLGAG